MLKNNQRKNKIDDRVLFKELMRFLRPHLSKFIWSLILMVFVVVVDLIPPLFFALVIENISSASTTADLRIVLLYLGAFVGVLLIALVINYFQSMILQVIGQKIIEEIRAETFSHIVNWSPEQLNREPIGKMVTRVMNDSESISQLFTSTIINLIRSIIMMILIFIILVTISVKLTLIVMTIIPVIGVISYFFRKITRKTYRKIRDEISELNAFLSENLSGMKITQIFNQEDKKREEFKEKSKNLEKIMQKEIMLYAIFRPLIYVVTNGSVILVLYFGGLQVIEMILSFAILYAFQEYANRFFQPVQQIAEEFNQLQDAFSSAEKIFSVLNEPAMIQDRPGAIELEEFKGHIEFKNVWFSYIEGEWVLKDVSFEVKPGQTVALVGATGSGKTTILSLIVRNYEIQKGQILIDGIDIKDIKYQSIRKHIGQMLQDVFLFNDTIDKNIRLNNDDIKKEDVLAASKYVGAHSFIDKIPGKYDHMVLERGNNFSTGQRQLISFARAVVTKPKLLILDEATANIDSESEEIIQDSLKRIMQDQTMIIVAHRLSTIQHSDKIIVLHKGRIVEEGNHQELLRNEGLYYNLYMIQFDEEVQKKVGK